MIELRAFWDAELAGLRDFLLGGGLLRAVAQLLHHTWRNVLRLRMDRVRMFWLEDVPKPECLVSSCACYSGAIGAQSEMENSACVASEVSDLLHLWVLPDAQLVIDEAMGREDLFVIGVPLQGAHLGLCILRVKEGACICVPEFDSHISRTTP